MKEALPVVLLCTRIVPKEQVDLNPYDMLYGKPFVYVNDLFLDYPVLCHGHLAIPTRYTLVGYKSGPKSF